MQVNKRFGHALALGDSRQKRKATTDKESGATPSLYQAELTMR
jgi:hypothetical protein